MKFKHIQSRRKKLEMPFEQSCPFLSGINMANGSTKATDTIDLFDFIRNMEP